MKLEFGRAFKMLREEKTKLSREDICTFDDAEGNILIKCSMLSRWEMGQIDIQIDKVAQIIEWIPEFDMFDLMAVVRNGELINENPPG